MGPENINLERQAELKEIILKIKSLFSELYKQKLYIILFSIIVTVGYISYKIVQPKQYSANLTYILNSKSGSGMSGFAGILGSLGFGGSSQNRVNLPLILDVSKSKFVVEKAMLDKVIVDGSEDFIANHLMKIEGIKEKWNKQELGLENFSVNSKLDSSMTYNRAMNLLYRYVIGTEKKAGILSSSYNDNSALLLLQTTTKNPELSIAISNQIYKHLDTFFLERIMLKQRLDLELLIEKRDSLQNQLFATENLVAKTTDKNYGLYTTKAKLKEIRLLRKGELIQQALLKIIEHVEIADFTLKNNTNYLQVLDSPSLPIFPKSKSIMFNIIIAFILSFIIASILVVLNKIYREAMK